MKISQKMRDVEVRDLMKLKFNLCDNCINRFTREELIIIFNERFKDEEKDKQLIRQIKNINECLEPKLWSLAMKESFILGYRLALQETFDKFDKYSCIKDDKWYKDYKKEKEE